MTSRCFPSLLLFSVSAILPQLVVVGLTIKRFISGLRAGWGRIPIVSRLVRDDVILVSVICEFKRKWRFYYRSFRSLKILCINSTLFQILLLSCKLFIWRFSDLDYIGSNPDEHQDRVWLHRLLVRPTLTTTPLLSPFLMPSASFHASLFFPSNHRLGFITTVIASNRSWLLSIIPSAVCLHFSDVSSLFANHGDLLKKSTTN